MEGIRPVLKNKTIQYERRDAIFKKLCSHALGNPEELCILIIDEINRGNIAKIFGELLYSLEYRSDEDGLILPYSDDDSNKRFVIPQNAWIIATMTSADRSIALVDYALRRRFFFIEFLPDAEILRSFFSRYPGMIDKDKVIHIFEKINQDIRGDDSLGRFYQLGHSYFMNKNMDNIVLTRIWKYALRPIREEYYFENYDQIQKLEDFIKEIINSSNQIENSPSD
jgi:5-methylcytosine-specific restriction enzyme B